MEMWTIIFFIILSVFAKTGTCQENTIDDTNWDGYNCVRTAGTAPCSGNGNCQSDGACICDTGFGGYDCSKSVSVSSGFVPNSQCSITCLNGGSCHRPDLASAVGETCLCTEEYTGTDCSQSRVLVDCLTGGMTVEVFPQAPAVSFRGLLAVQSPNSNALRTEDGVCSFRYDNIFFYNGARFRVGFSTDSIGQCLADMEETPLGPNGNNQLCYNLRLVYSPFFIITASDEVFRVCCNELTSNDGGQITVGTGGGNTGSEADVNGTVEIITSNLVFTDSGLPVTSGVNVGDLISFVVNFVNSAVRYDDIRVVSCTAFPNNIPLVTNSCPDPLALSIVRDIRKPNQGEVFLDIWAFRPSTDEPVTLSCDIQVCIGSCSAPSTCPGTNIRSLGRRKRQAQNTTGETEILTRSQVFKVYVEPSPQTSCPKQECGIVKEVFLPVAIVFGVLLLAVLGVATFLCFRQSKDRNGKATA